jgi:biopolymer transport protein ExbD/biopolymer transport protein TolR
MAIDVGRTTGKGVNPDMNVTPLIDVVLVLLIIFMAMTPLMNKKFWVHTPKQEKEEVEQEDLNNDPKPPLVLHVADDRTITVNGVVIGYEELPYRLRRMFAARQEHVVFFDAGDEVKLGFAVEIMDRAREGGAVTIASLTKKLGQAEVAPAADGAPPEAGPADAAASAPAGEPAAAPAGL